MPSFRVLNARGIIARSSARCGRFKTFFWLPKHTSLPRLLLNLGGQLGGQARPEIAPYASSERGAHFVTLRWSSVAVGLRVRRVTMSVRGSHSPSTVSHWKEKLYVTWRYPVDAILWCF